jgi:hypothetical protein
MSAPLALPWMSSPDELSTIGWVYGVSETAIVVSRLKAAGIDALADSRQLAKPFRNSNRPALTGPTRI